MDGRKQIATAVKDYIARERLSREQFAFKTKLGKSTVDKLLIGLFSDRTLVIVEEHTKLQLRPLLGDETASEAAEDGVALAPALALARAPSERLGERTDRPAIDRPSIAVLPFTNMDGDPAQDFLADGITE